MQGGADMKLRELTGMHVLAILLAFFGVVFAVNGVMTWVALTTFSGIETPNAYQRGRQYNEVLAAAAAQRALGWQAAIETRFGEAAAPVLGASGPATPANDASGNSAEGQPVEIVLEMTDRDGAPVTGLSGTATFRRPVTRGLDVMATLMPEGAGRYRAAALLPAPGRWEIRLDLTRPGGAPYHLARRIFVPPPAAGADDD